MSGDDEREQADFEFGQWQDEEGGWEDQPPPRGRGRKRALIVCGSAAALAVAALIAVEALSSGPASLSPAAHAVPTTPPGFSPSSTDPAQAAQQTAQAFLTDWQSGNIAAAAALTDSPAAAQTALDAYKTDLDLSQLSLQVQNSSADGSVAFSVAATVGLSTLAGSSGSAAGATATAAPTAPTWTYTSSLTAYPSGQSWLVQWNPTILAANMTADTHLMIVPVPPGVGAVTDSKGNNLAQAADPGLQHIATLLAANAPSGQGTPGIDIAVVDSTNTAVPGVGSAVISQPVATGNLATTIDPTAEAAAMAAVGTNPQSSMVVLQPSTGDILAIANNDGGNDDALITRIAPGSTMKVVTSTALLNQGMTPHSSVTCPAVFDGTGFPFQNSGGESRPPGTELIDDFAVSCNNAFTSQYQKLEGGLLANTAQTYYGLNEPWNIGLGDPQTYFTMPSDADGTELAAEAFGQGTLGASPLAMASVAATVDTGSFHQPILLAGTHQVGATPLPGGTDSELREMMRAVVTYSDGTAHHDGFGSDVYAKTGTADEGAAGATPNSWIIVFDPAKDVAIGCVVLNGNFGAQTAGPEAESVLAAM